MSDIDDRLLALADSVAASEAKRLPLLTLAEARAAIELLHCSAPALAMERTQPGTWPGIWPDGCRSTDSTGIRSGGTWPRRAGLRSDLGH
ncbi:hypothetical protein Sgleb_04600 [Streptomyces glebosus]|uniref:Uncharacterized protein n=1 Tax=Streptomyces glebosus TaxID=249580 RepID=A0A640SLM1_9ACTN|nr:hypothetical protein [Streptomyces glebosus]GFE12413.1 hypothetical protein Sgleb_04600 [Streptomyces glebosus]GHG82866.1 hypothetical protein GCM10010513_62070 [Streptomyces glebosus]